MMLFPEADAASIQRRFDAKVMPEPNSGCWLWTASLSNKGYAELMMRHTRRVELGHRISYNLHRGAIPDGLQVLHRCDMQCCVNPDHLWLGTAKDNMQDCVKKGRTNKPKGEAHERAKLSDQDVISIRQDHRSSRMLGELYGVSHTVIVHARSRKTWRHI